MLIALFQLRNLQVIREYNPDLEMRLSGVLFIASFWNGTKHDLCAAAERSMTQEVKAK